MTLPTDIVYEALRVCKCAQNRTKIVREDYDNCCIILKVTPDGLTALKRRSILYTIILSKTISQSHSYDLCCSAGGTL